MSNPVGRPSMYKPEYCQEVIRMGAEGKSVLEMAVEIGVHRNTLETNWPAQHPEFLEALTHARECSQAWWEAQGRDNLLTPPKAGTFQASVWSRSMAARFPNDWREKSETAITGANGGPIEHTHTLSAETGRLLEGLSAIGANSGPASPVQD